MKKEKQVFNENSGEWHKKYQDLQKEMNLLKEEHRSNVKDMRLKIEELETKLQFKTQQAIDYQKQE